MAELEALGRLKIYPILDELRACLCAKVPDACFCGFIIGDDIPVEYAGDSCDQGAAYVRLLSVYPSTVSFPAQDSVNVVGALRAYQISVGILRGAPYGDGLEPPEPDDVNAYSLAIMDDMQTIWETISCCLTGDKFEEADPQVLRGLYTPIPVSGGVGGGEWSLTIQDW